MEEDSTIKNTKTIQLRMGERRSLLVIGDFLMALMAMLISVIYWGSNLKFIQFNWEFLQSRVPVWFYFLPMIWVILMVNLYDVNTASNWKRTKQEVLIAAMIGIGLYLIIYIIYVEPQRAFLPRRGVLSFLVLVILFTLLWRRLYINIFTQPQFMRRVLLVGGGKTGEILLQIVNGLNTVPFTLFGIIDDDPEKRDLVIDGYPVLGTSTELMKLIRENNISELIVAISGEMNGRMFQALLDVQEKGIDITRMPVAYEELLGRVPIRWLEADWILRSFVDQARSRGFYEFGKRVFDILGGLLGTLLYLIFCPFIALFVWLDDGSPIFYSQVRSGKNARQYTILKFRTMHRDAEANGIPQWAKENDARATRTGKFLRKTHLDELPQFVNVLKGEMSLVGPRAERPELIELFEKYVPFYRARLLIKPGITGWAQVHQNYAATIDETVIKLEYDLYYIKHRNIILDIVIILRTPSTMLGFRGR